MFRRTSTPAQRRMRSRVKDSTIGIDIPSTRHRNNECIYNSKKHGRVGGKDSKTGSEDYRPVAGMQAVESHGLTWYNDHRPGRSSAWIERLLGVQEVASSNLVAPTI